MKHNMRLLIVDDDPDDRKFFVEAAKEIDGDIECRTANNGQQAMDLLHDTTSFLPDLIFLDIRMPLLSGKQCLYEIKHDDRLQHIPVIIYTTSRGIEESKELMEMGAYHFISKPGNADDIYYLVSVIVEEFLQASHNNSPENIN